MGVGLTRSKSGTVISLLPIFHSTFFFCDVGHKSNTDIQHTDGDEYRYSCCMHIKNPSSQKKIIVSYLSAIYNVCTIIINSDTII